MLKKLFIFLLLCLIPIMASASVSVVVSTPTASATVTSPVEIKATAKSTLTSMSGWYIYVDNNAVWNTPGPASSIDAFIPLSLGTHYVVVRAWDKYGYYGSAKFYVTVAKPKPVTTVTLVAPTEGTYTGPVTFNATATSTNGINGWVIYCDDENVYQIDNQSNELTATVTLTLGQHMCFVRGWDKVSGFGSSAKVAITIVDAPPPPPPPDPIQTTTTLSAETGNNTSASDLFKGTYNGNVAPGNVSKVDTRMLMPGFTGKIFAHYMGWFCMKDGSTATGDGTMCDSHRQVGYNSDDPAQEQKAIADMLSRGIEGVVHDWYGAGTRSDRVAKNLLAAAEAQRFTYMTMIDKGALKWFTCSGCTPTQAMIKHTQYVVDAYTGSPAYFRINGRPVITSFDLYNYSGLDWNAVAAAVPEVYWVFQGTGGFTHVQTGGSYSWGPTAGLSYLTDFYNAGTPYPNLFMMGSAYKGFDDRLASWSLNRVTSQQCGQLWLGTFGRVVPATDAIQIVTWDDYEEGTEIETGIDNCVSITASLSGTTLSWAITGNENTLDHYTVFASTDGENLVALGDFATGVHQLDLSTVTMLSGTYQLYVKAVGKPSLTNHMAGPVRYVR